MINMPKTPDDTNQTQQDTISPLDQRSSQLERDDILTHLVDLAGQSVDGPLTMLTVVSPHGGCRWIGGDHLNVSDICRERLVAAILGDDVPPRSELDDVQPPNVIGDVLTIDPDKPRLRWIAARIPDRGALIACDWEPWEPDERVAAILSGFALFIEQELVRQEFQDPHPHTSEYDQFKDLIVDSAQDGVAGVNFDGRCRFINETGANLLDRLPEEIIGEPVGRLFTRADNELESELLHFQQGKRVEVEDASLLRRDGTLVPIELTALPNVDHDGKITGAVLRFSDLSERQAALLAARHSEARHQAFLQMTLDSIITVDQEGRILEFNHAAENTFRCAADEVLGEDMAAVLFPQPWRDWYRAAFVTFSESGAGPLSDRRIQVTAQRANGSNFPAEITITRLPAGDEWIFTLYIHDLTERKWNDRRRITRYTVTRILAESESPTEALPQILETICQGLEWDWAAIWMRNPGTPEMVIDRTWNRQHIHAGPLEIAAREMTFEPGDGFIGEVWRNRESSWIEDLREPGSFRRAEAALACGIHSVAAMPIIGRQDVIGVFELFSQWGRDRDPEMLRLMDSLGSQIGQFIERKQVEEERVQILAREQAARSEAEAAERRLAFLAEASAQLSSSLDYQVTLSNVARLAVPKLGDYCAIDMLDEDGVVRSLEIADINPEKERLGRELNVTHPINQASDHPVAQVLRTGRPLLVPETNDEFFDLFGLDDYYVTTLRGMGIDSAMYVPLIARGRTMGVVSIVASESGHRYGTSDLALAQELTRRAALAIDNARLYREARESVRIREEFLSIASHELKTPLTTVKGYSQIIARLLRRTTIDRDRLIYLANQLQDQLGRFETLIADLLDVSRIQRGGLELRPEPIDLVELTRNVLNRFQYPSESDGRHIFKLNAPASYAGVWDPDRLDQVLTNLISNAVKYSPLGGEIIVGIYPEMDDSVRIAVTDRGIGIPEAEQGQLFRPFARSETVQRAISGVGLGLYISQQIVDRHGGTITLESLPEKGSTFTVKLPRIYTDGAGGSSL